ncbi:MAG: glycosyl transferase [Gemmatimonadetes bacterium]|jgi:glycosyltransferase involved in cell wall biosynthesis|nr:glycosyl transferase [Gemmatimonadota bacterium]
MALRLAHASVVHDRYDIRMLVKECVSFAADDSVDVTLFVADGKPDEVWKGVRITSVPRPPFGRLGRATLGSLRMWRALRRFRPELVHVHNPELLPLALALQSVGTPVVFDMHENLPKDILTKGWVPRPLRRLLSGIVTPLQAAAVRRIPTVFAELSYADDFPDARLGTVVLNYPLLGPLSEISRPKRARFTVGYFGSVTAERGAHDMIAAVALLRARGMELDFVLAGKVSDDVAAAEDFRSAVAAGWMTTTGMIRAEEGWALMAECHMGLAMLHPSPNFVGSYTTKMFEYMALRLPFVISDIPLWRAVVDDARCALCIRPADPVGLAEAIAWIHDHPEEAAAMGERGREVVIRTRSWDSEFAKLKSLYAKVLA